MASSTCYPISLGRAIALLSLTCIVDVHSPMPSDVPVGAQIAAAGADYICYGFGDPPSCTDGQRCSIGSQYASGDMTTTTVNPGASLSAVGCSSKGNVAAHVVRYPLRAGTPTFNPPAGQAPPKGVLITAPLALVICYTLDGTRPACDAWKVPHCLAGTEIGGNSAQVVLPRGRCTLKAVGCALGGGSGVMQGEFIGTGIVDIFTKNILTDDNVKDRSNEDPGHILVVPKVPPEQQHLQTTEPMTDGTPASTESVISVEKDGCDAGAIETQVLEEQVDGPSCAIEPFLAEVPRMMPEGPTAPPVPVAVLQPGLGIAGATLLTLISSKSDCLCYVLDGSLPTCGPHGFTCDHGVAGYGGVVAIVLPAKFIRLHAIACSASGPSSPLEITFTPEPQQLWTPVVIAMVSLAISVLVHAIIWGWQRFSSPGKLSTIPPEISAIEEALEKVQEMQCLLEQEGRISGMEEKQRSQQLDQLDHQLHGQSQLLIARDANDSFTGFEDWDRAVCRTQRDS